MGVERIGEIGEGYLVGYPEKNENPSGVFPLVEEGGVKGRPREGGMSTLCGLVTAR